MAKKKKATHFTKEHSENFKKSFYELPEEEIQEIVNNAQNGDDDAMLRIIEIFDNFLTKYTNILITGQFSLSDQDVRKFVSLFIKDYKLRLFVLRNESNKNNRRLANNIIGGISYMVNRYGNYDDVRHTVDISFIECVQRYEKKGEVPFSGFIYSYYYFVLKRNIDTYLIDQLGLKTFPLISDGSEDSYEDSTGRSPGFHEPIVEDDFLLLVGVDIDDDWVMGDTAKFPFSELSIQQRQLIRWRYILGETSSQISDRVGEHPNTIRDKFNKIREALFNAMGNKKDFVNY